MHGVKKVLILDWHDLPQKFKDEVGEREYFGNNRYLPFYSELDVAHIRKGMPAVEDYWKDQQVRSGFNGDIQEFIVRYGLEMTVWVIEQNFDLDGVQEILIKVFW